MKPRALSMTLLGLACWGGLHAAPETGAVDLDYGEEIYETCAGCHGAMGEGTPDGEYPRLAGLPRGYIEKQLRDFKSRARLNIPMFPYTTERELPEEDLQAVAAYLARIDLPTRLPPLDESSFDALARLQQSKYVVNIAPGDGDPQAGARFYRGECRSCHAADGYGKADEFVPPLAGQHSAYLNRQIRKYRSGERLHADDPTDQEVFQEIPESQVQDLLSYLATLDDG